MQPPDNHLCVLRSLHSPTNLSQEEEDTQALMSLVQPWQHVIFVDSAMPFQGGKGFGSALRRIQRDDSSN